MNRNWNAAPITPNRRVPTWRYCMSRSSITAGAASATSAQMMSCGTVMAESEAMVSSRSRVSLALIDPENPYRYLEIRGRVVEITEEGADEHINKMAKKYLGVDKYPYSQSGEVRVMYKIKPEHTTVMG